MKRGELSVLALAIVFGITSLMLFDVQISQSIANLRSFIPDIFFIGFTFEIQTLVVLFFLTSLFLFKEHKRRWIVPLWLTALVAAISSFIIKYLVARPRPFEAGVVSVLKIAYNMIIQSAWAFSFPSFQAVLAFSALPILDKEFPRFKWIWFVIACIIGLSRVYFGLHYMSDVILGGVIGYFLGYIVVKLEEKYKFGKRVIRKLKLGK